MACYMLDSRRRPLFDGESQQAAKVFNAPHVCHVIAWDPSSCPMPNQPWTRQEVAAADGFSSELPRAVSMLLTSATQLPALLLS